VHANRRTQRDVSVIRNWSPVGVIRELETHVSVRDSLEVRFLRPEDVFAVHQKIRFAGLARRNGQVLFLQMREGVVSFTPDSRDRTALEIHTQYIVETAEQESRWAGPVEHIAITFEKYVELIIPLEETYLAITVEKDVPAESYSEICKAIRTLDVS
jgi:hypothetical protein